MCTWGTYKKVKVIRRNNPSIPDGEHFVSVDACIADEVEQMNGNRIITVGSCCGHGKVDKKQVLIDAKSKGRAEALAYKVSEYTPEHTKAGVLQILF